MPQATSRNRALPRRRPVGPGVGGPSAGHAAVAAQLCIVNFHCTRRRCDLRLLLSLKPLHVYAVATQLHFLLVCRDGASRTGRSTVVSHASFMRAIDMQLALSLRSGT